MFSEKARIVRLMKAITTYGWISGYIMQMLERVPFTFITAKPWVALTIHYKGVRDFENILQIIGK